MGGDGIEDAVTCRERDGRHDRDRDKLAGRQDPSAAQHAGDGQSVLQDKRSQILRNAGRWHGDD